MCYEYNYSFGYKLYNFLYRISFENNKLLEDVPWERKTKNMKRIISNNKGITGIDLTIGIIVLSIFSGVIISLMVNTYSKVVEIRKSANAMAYATIILEKVDEKSFEKVNDSFVSYLEALGEVDISDDYKVEFSTETLEDSFKKAIITVRYDVNGEEKSITINKLKVKEK